MQSRWWYADENKNHGKDKIEKSKKSPSKRNGGIRKWKFCVMVNYDLNQYEKIAVTGSCDELGAWDCDSCVLLERNEGSDKSSDK